MRYQTKHWRRNTVVTTVNLVECVEENGQMTYIYYIVQYVNNGVIPANYKMSCYISFYACKQDDLYWKKK
jgi:hypothetical protein